MLEALTADKACVQWWVDMVRYPELVENQERAHVLNLEMAQEFRRTARSLIKFAPGEIRAFESCLGDVVSQYGPKCDRDVPLVLRFAWDAERPLSEAIEAVTKKCSPIEELTLGDKLLEYRIKPFLPAQTYTELTSDGKLYKGSMVDETRELIFEHGRWVGSEAAKNEAKLSAFSGSGRPVLDKDNSTATSIANPPLQKANLP